MGGESLGGGSDVHVVGLWCTGWDVCSTAQRLAMKVKIHVNGQEMGGQPANSVELWTLLEAETMQHQWGYNKNVEPGTLMLAAGLS